MCPVCACGQRNIDKITENLTGLEAKLAHEQEKFRTYNEDLQTAEQKCAASHGPVLVALLFVGDMHAEGSGGA